MIQSATQSLIFDETFALNQTSQREIRLLVSTIEPTDGSDRYCLHLVFSAGDLTIAEARLSLGSRDVQTSIVRRGMGFQIEVGGGIQDRSSATRWRLWVRPTDSGLEMIEVGTGPEGTWTWNFPGTTLHTNRGGDHISMPVPGSKFRFGPYSQYGQIFDFKDWFAVEQSNAMAGLMLLRPGKWRDPAQTLGHGRGDDAGVTLSFPVGQVRVRRSYMLVHPSVAVASARTLTGMRRYRTNDFAYPSWPAKQIANHGLARPERLTQYQAVTESVEYKQPAHFLFGGNATLHAAFERARRIPNLTKHQPIWAGEFARTLDHLMDVLRDSHHILVEGGVLHPFGNPVLLRPVTPAIITFHILDCLGHVTPEQRGEFAQLVAALTELTCRLDFYDSRLAHSPTGEPGWTEPLFRGMHNQNFNTDRYVAIALAGCVLPEHPHAGFWRRHAIGQFKLQMDSFVWPSGAWEESHSYANVVRTLLLCLVQPLRQAPEKFDLLANEKFRKMCGFQYHLLGTPDALLGGARGWPAIGDHGYAAEQRTPANWSWLFGWFATFFPEEHDKWMWTWSQTLYLPFDGWHDVSTLMAPLFLPEIPTTLPVPTAPASGVRALAGFGAVARLKSGEPDESVLVVRGGPSWGHYHHDQGSFWWWCRGRLVCADSGLGGGPLKFQHCGHNVMGYVDRNPSQYLDRVPFLTTRAQATTGGADFLIDIPTYSWNIGHATDSPIPIEKRPHHLRRIELLDGEQIRITDESERSPDGFLVWSLHGVARDCRVSDKTVRWDLGDEVALVLELPSVPLEVTFERHSPTIGVRLKYREQTLVHTLRVESAK